MIHAALKIDKKDIETPLLTTAFNKTDEGEIKVIQKHSGLITQELGLDLNDDSLVGTPSC